MSREIGNDPLAQQQVCSAVTDTGAIGHLAPAGQVMERIESPGYGSALDDFASGLSSFGYPRALPVDALEIDGQRIRGIVDDGVNRERVRSIHGMGRVLDLETVAELVDDAATRDILDGIGVDLRPGPLHRCGAPTGAPTRSASPTHGGLGILTAYNR